MSPGMTFLKWEKSHNTSFNSFELWHKNFFTIIWNNICIYLAYLHNILYISCKLMTKLIKNLQCYHLKFVSVLILMSRGRGLFIYLMLNNTERKSVGFISPIKCRWPTQKNDFFSFRGYQHLFLATLWQSSGDDYQRQAVWRGEM